MSTFYITNSPIGDRIVRTLDRFSPRAKSLAVVECEASPASIRTPANKHIASLLDGISGVRRVVFRGLSRERLELAGLSVERLFADVKAQIVEVEEIAIIGTALSQFGEWPTVQHVGVPHSESETLLRDVAETEFLGMLDRYDAINIAEHAHYCLPSGVHSDVYIRVADIFRSQLVVHRIADWIMPHLSLDSVLIVDSWTLVALSSEISKRFTAQAPCDYPELQVLMFEEYPTARSMRTLLDSISGLLVNRDSLSVIALVSVVSTGTLVSTIDALIREKADKASVRILPMVNLLTANLSHSEIVRLEGFSHFAHQRGVHCSLCADPEKREIIYIDPSKYQPRVETRTEEVMLDHREAARMPEFWQTADRTDAVRVHRWDPDTKRHLLVSIDIAKLLGDIDFKKAILDSMIQTFPHTEVVLIPRNSCAEALCTLALTAFPHATQFEFDRQLQNQEELLCAFENLKNAANILILDDSIISGGTIRRAHRAIQEIAPRLLSSGALREHYVVSSFVVVARPAHLSIWNGLRDSLRQFGGSAIESKYIVILPNEPCPWCDEIILIDQLISLFSLMSDSRLVELLRKRKAHLLPSPGDPTGGLSKGLFLCDASGAFCYDKQSRITPNSLFGDRLGEASAFAAVSSAMQRIRDEKGSAKPAHRGSVWCWDVRRIVSAYHDPILQCSFLRSATGSELFVPPSRGVRSTIGIALTSNDGNSVAAACSLAGEHGLAAIQGKYSLARRSEILSLSARSLSKHPCHVQVLLDAILERES